MVSLVSFENVMTIVMPNDNSSHYAHFSGKKWSGFQCISFGTLISTKPIIGLKICGKQCFGFNVDSTAAMPIKSNVCILQSIEWSVFRFSIIHYSFHPKIQCAFSTLAQQQYKYNPIDFSSYSLNQTTVETCKFHKLC